MSSIKTNWGCVISAAALVASAAAQAPSRAAPPPAGFPPGPSAHIDSFTAQPNSIQPGQSVTLNWAAVNADRIFIDNGIGVVATRGALKVTPSATTTYTIEATGRAGMDRKTVTVTVAGTKPKAAVGSIETALDKPVPRAPDGHPDLSGVYMGGFAIHPLGKVTLKTGAERFKVPEKEEDLGQGVLCVPPGVPMATMQPYPLQIVQKPKLVVILYEAYGLFRVIPIGRPHPSDLDPTWMGNSVGHWEGDTLVVDVTGFNDKTEIGGYRHTKALHVVERYRRPRYDTVEYEATIEDPNVFAAPWKFGGPLVLHPEWDLQEYVCEENNKNYQELFKQK